MITDHLLFCIENIFRNNIFKFDKKYIHNKCHEEESCIDISHISLFYYSSCTIASEVINIGLNRLHHSIP